MSTRRSARAASKGPSEISNATSVAPKTPRRTTRSNAGLPNVGTRTSNAYGTNATAGPARAGGPEVANQIGGVLEDLLQAGARATPARQRRATSVASTSRGRDEPSFDQSRTFNNESGVFGVARLESSVPSINLSNIREEQDDEDEDEDEEEDDYEQPTPRQPLFTPQPNFRAQPQQNQRQDGVRRGAEKTQRVDLVPEVSRFTIIKEQVKAFIARTQIDWPLLIKSSLAVIGLLTLSFMLLTSIPGTGFHNYGFSPIGMKHNLGQFVPFRSTFSTSDVKDLRTRIWKAEQEIIKLQQRPSLDHNSIKKLHHILPESIVAKKDGNGRLVLPNGLWRAIHDKIQADPTLVFSGSSAGDGALVSTKQVDAVIAQSAEKYFKSNDFKGKVIDGRFSHLLHNARNEDLVISKSEAIDLIRDSWEDHQHTIKTEMLTIRNELDQLVRQVSKLEDGPQTQAEIEAIAKDVFAKLLPGSQLGALAKANIQSNINYGYNKVNHFSQGTGAVVNVKLVSPNFVFPDMQVWPWERKIRAWFLDAVPLPKPPSEALKKWDEHGDCWCSPAKADTGFGTSLAVIMGSDIYPEEVVIEHIPATAALEPGAAPKEMELLAFVPEDRYDAIKVVSNDLFAEDAKSDQTPLPAGYVRVGTWTYDSKAAENIQAFDVQLDLKSFHVHTSKLIVRARNNWGDIEYTCLYRVRVHGEIVQTPGTY